MTPKKNSKKKIDQIEAEMWDNKTFQQAKEKNAG